MNEITITANGDSYRLAEHTPIEDFLKTIELTLEQVVVEYNGRANTREEASQISLADGDSLEIVRIVAGG